MNLETLGNVPGVNPVGPLSYISVLRQIVTDYIKSETILMKDIGLPEVEIKKVMERVEEAAVFSEKWCHTLTLSTQLTKEGVLRLWTEIKSNTAQADFLFYLVSKFKLFYSDVWDDVIRNVAQAMSFSLKLPKLDNDDKEPYDNLETEFLEYPQIVEMFKDNNWLVIISLLSLTDPRMV